jgi:hypothetical protein
MTKLIAGEEVVFIGIMDPVLKDSRAVVVEKLNRFDYKVATKDGFMLTVAEVFLKRATLLDNTLIPIPKEEPKVEVTLSEGTPYVLVEGDECEGRN